MKLLMLIVLITLQGTSLIYANNNSKRTKPLILVEAKIYKFNAIVEGQDLQIQMKNAVLESSPILITIAGKKAAIKVGAEGMLGKPVKMMSISIISDENAAKYDLDLKVLDGGNESITHINDYPIGQALTLSATLGNITKMIILNTKKMNEEEASKYRN